MLGCWEKRDPSACLGLFWAWILSDLTVFSLRSLRPLREILPSYLFFAHFALFARDSSFLPSSLRTLRSLREALLFFLLLCELCDLGEMFFLSSLFFASFALFARNSPFLLAKHAKGRPRPHVLISVLTFHLYTAQRLGSLADREQARRAQRNGGQVHPIVLLTFNLNYSSTWQKKA